jgi:hypothetical protein
MKRPEGKTKKTEENKEMFKRQIEYVEAVKQLQQAIGSENTVSSVNITNS